MTLETWSELNPDKPMRARGIPRYDEVIELGLGHWLHDPDAAPPDRVVIE
jgi:hypothetical protein